jgi:ABC-2 type transport system permease protein
MTLTTMTGATAGLLRSEWTKLRSVRSTWWCAASYALLVLALGWLAAAVTDRAPRADIAVTVALTGFGIGQLVLVVQGVLAGAGEFTTGMAVASFATVPRRTRLLLAKTVVLAAATAALSFALGLGCFLAARTLTRVDGGVGLADPGVLRALVLQSAVAVTVVVLGVALGTVLRSTAGGVGLGVVLALVLPPLLAADDRPVTRLLSDALPAFRVGEDAFLAGPETWPVGLAVLTAWAVGTWLLAAAVLERRDV